jgi:ABC-type Fe3+/spermidine/putrescine transport system ATPase subunit
MRAELRRIHRETGLTVLYVTHDQKEALSLADRVALMLDGRIIQTGQPRQLYHNPSSRFAAAFLGEANFVRGTFRGAERDQAAVEVAASPVSARPPADPLADGAPCDVVVRPESVELLPANVIRPPNGLRATVADLSFLGELEQAVVRLAGGGGEMKSVALPRADAPWKPGDPVWVSFAPQAATVFPIDDAEGGPNEARTDHESDC